MIKDKMLEAMNEQMKMEFSSAYIYLAMAAYFESKTLPGFANWMMTQHQEELSHAMKFYTHITDRGSTPEVRGFDDPNNKFSSPLDAFNKTLEHEQLITSCIDKLYDLAVQENDKPSQFFLQWFVDEQVEEEKNVGEVIDSLKMIGDSGHALLMLDRELATRTFIPDTGE